MRLSTFIVTALFSVFIVSCKNVTNENSEPITPAETRSTMEYNQNQLDTISENTVSSDFKGGGGEPFWSLEIVDKKLHFQSPEENFKSIVTTINNVDVSGNTISFVSQNERDTINVELVEEECTDGMSGKINTHKIMLSITKPNQDKSRKYEGCGYFIIKKV